MTPTPLHFAFLALKSKETTKRPPSLPPHHHPPKAFKIQQVSHYVNPTRPTPVI